MLYSNVWEHGNDAKEERLWVITCKPIPVSCNGPGHLGFLFDGKLKGSPQHYTINYGGTIPTLPERLPGIRIMFFVSNHNALAFLLPKLAEATLNRG